MGKAVVLETYIYSSIVIIPLLHKLCVIAMFKQGCRPILYTFYTKIILKFDTHILNVYPVHKYL